MPHPNNPVFEIELYIYTTNEHTILHEKGVRTKKNPIKLIVYELDVHNPCC